MSAQKLISKFRSFGLPIDGVALLRNGILTVGDRTIDVHSCNFGYLRTSGVKRYRVGQKITGCDTLNEVEEDMFLVLILGEDKNLDQYLKAAKQILDGQKDIQITQVDINKELIQKAEGIPPSLNKIARISFEYQYQEVGVCPEGLCEYVADIQCDVEPCESKSFCERVQECLPEPVDSDCTLEVLGGGSSVCVNFLVDEYIASDEGSKNLYQFEVFDSVGFERLIDVTISDVNPIYPLATTDIINAITNGIFNSIGGKWSMTIEERRVCFTLLSNNTTAELNFIIGQRRINAEGNVCDETSITGGNVISSSCTNDTITHKVSLINDTIEVTDNVCNWLQAHQTAIEELQNNPTGLTCETLADCEIITDIQDTLADKANTSDLAAVAFSNDYNDLSNKPTIPTVPTNVSAFTNDAGYQTAAQVSAAITAVKPITLIGIDNTATALTGSATNGVLGSILIPANTMTVGTIAEIEAFLRKASPSAQPVHRLWINTANNVTGATTLGLLSGTISTLSSKMERSFIVTNTGLTIFNTSQNSAIDDAQVAAAVSDIVVNWGVDQYLLHTANNAVGETTTNIFLYMKKATP